MHIKIVFSYNQDCCRVKNDRFFDIKNICNRHNSDFVRADEEHNKHTFVSFWKFLTKYLHLHVQRVRLATKLIMSPELIMILRLPCWSTSCRSQEVQLAWIDDNFAFSQIFGHWKSYYDKNIRKPTISSSPTLLAKYLPRPKLIIAICFGSPWEWFNLSLWLSLGFWSWCTMNLGYWI